MPDLVTRVLHIPSEHPYITRVCPPAYLGAPRLTQIPSPALTVDWVRAHHDEFDVVHLHFGFEQRTPDELRQWTDELRRLGKPLVHTVHDLRNPHQRESGPHTANLDVLIPAADAVLTLTEGAAAQIRRRWGRSAEVLPHPAVFDRSQVARALIPNPAREDGAQVVGIHLKDLRRNVVEPDQVVAATLAGAQAVGAVLRVDLHPGATGHPDLRLTRRLAEQGRIDLRVHERFSDADLAGYLAELDAYVLPYRFGTHSGWLEACRDVGTRVVAPSCGFYAEQWEDVVGYPHDERTGLDPAGLSEAVVQALTRPPVLPDAPGFRRQQEHFVRSAHAAVYDRVRAGGTEFSALAAGPGAVAV